MTTVLTVLVIVVLLAVGAGVGWLLRGRQFEQTLDAALVAAAAEEPDVEAEVRGALEAMLLATRGANPIRFEISLDDWGPVQGAMRWRWTIWDADRQTLARLESDAAASIGVEIPVMLGNAPTKSSALIAALNWVLDEGGTVVVVPSLVAVEAEGPSQS